MSGGGAGNTSSGSTKFEPPKYAAPYDVKLLQRADQISQTPFQPYTGQLAAGTSPLQNQGFNLASGYANQGNVLAGVGGQQLYSTLEGNNLSGNPYLDSVINQSNTDISNQYKYATGPQNAARASMSGSFDNTGVQQKDAMDQFSLARALGSNEQNMRFANYANERQNQVGAINPALGYGQDTLSGLAAGGGIQQQTNQAKLNADYAEFQRQIGQPTQNLNALQQALATAQGGFGAQSGKTPNPSPLLYPLAIAGGMK